MKLLIVNCHWDNRGDEAAIRAMIDELQARYPEADIYVQRALGTFGSFPENEKVKTLPAFPVGGKKRGLQERISYWTNGRVNLTRGARAFYKALKGADLVLHAPGGPSIGDIYLQQEILKLRRLMAIRKSGVPYVFYAPSMGPFQNEERNPVRKEVLENASLICLREEISKEMVKAFVPSTEPIVTLDSAFQHPIDMEANRAKFEAYQALAEFVGDGENVIGMTTTDLQWNRLYRNDGKTEALVREVFTKFVAYLTGEGYKVLFIPQLFEASNDYDYMRSFATEHCYVMSDRYDCYFQQYVISRLKAVVGMRYHSNIFSAKMGIPFVSVSYEQKMQGFMQKAGLIDYCLAIGDLSFDSLKEKFDAMMQNYDSYRERLGQQKETFRKEASRTTELVCELLDAKQGK